MNRQKINKLIAYTTLCCSLTLNIPNLAYAENNTNKDYTPFKITLDSNLDVQSKQSTREAALSFSDSNFEAALRTSLDLTNGEPIYQSTIDNITGIILSIAPNNIKSLEDLSKFTNLKSLTLYDNDDGLDLTVTKSLSNLSSLGLNKGSFDLSQFPVAQIIDLRITDAIIDNSVLSTFSNLKILEYSMTSETGNTSFDFVNNLTNINSLVSLTVKAYGNVNSEVTKLAKLTNLQELTISVYDKEAVNLDFVSSLLNLKKISVWNCNPTTVSALNSLSLLESVSISKSSLTNEHLLLMQDTLNRVTTADLSYNKLTSVDVIDTIFATKEIKLYDNYIDLTSEKTKSFFDTKSDSSMYPQYKLTTRESGTNFLLNIDESFDIHALALESIKKDGSSLSFSVDKDDIEYYIAKTDTDFLKVDENNNLIATKAGNATVHVRIKGTDGVATSTTINVSATTDKDNTGVVVVKTINDSNQSIGDNQTSLVFNKGLQTILAPTVKGYYPIEGENIYRKIDVVAGSSNEVSFKYKTIDSGLTDVGKVQILYVDNYGQEISNTEFVEYLSLSSHDVPSKTIDGYTLISNATETVNLTASNPYKVVTFEYRDSSIKVDKGSLTINCVDDETNTIISTKTESDLPLGVQTRTAGEIAGYTIVGETTKSVNLTESIPNATIEFRYKSVNSNDDNQNTPITKGKITVNYIDSDSGEAILSAKVLNDLDLKAHTISADSIQGYELVGNASVTVTLTESKPTENITFSYKKISSDNTDSEVKTGTVTIYYVDSQSKSEIATKEVKTGLELKDHTFTAKEIQGFTAINATQNVSLSKTNNSQEITFEYSNIVESSDSVSFTLTPSLLKYYVDNDYSWSLSGDGVGLFLSNEVLGEIESKASENVVIKFNDNIQNKTAYDNILKKYKINILKTISLSNNIPELTTNKTVSLQALIPSSYSGKNIYLYEVSGDGVLNLISTDKPTTKSDNIMASFDVNVNALNNIDFIVSDTKIDTSGNIITDTNTNTNTDKTDSDKNLPDTSGSAGLLLGLSFTSMFAGFKLNKKRK